MIKSQEHLGLGSGAYRASIRLLTVIGTGGCKKYITGNVGVKLLIYRGITSCTFTSVLCIVVCKFIREIMAEGIYCQRPAFAAIHTFIVCNTLESTGWSTDDRCLLPLMLCGNRLATSYARDKVIFRLGNVFA